MSQRGQTVRLEINDNWTFKGNSDLKELLDYIANLIATEYVDSLKSSPENSDNGGD